MKQEQIINAILLRFQKYSDRDTESTTVNEIWEQEGHIFDVEAEIPAIKLTCSYRDQYGNERMEDLSDSQIYYDAVQLFRTDDDSECLSRADEMAILKELNDEYRK